MDATSAACSCLRVIADIAAAMAFCPLVRVADVALSERLCSFDVFKAPSKLTPMAPEWFGESSTLWLLEELCESTWAIVQDRHPFRDLTNESDLKHQLRRKLFILAENSDLEDLDGLQRSVLEALARGVDY